MNSYFNWLHEGPIPSNAMQGSYDLKLVVVSYIIAVLASYVALNIAGRLRSEKNPNAEVYWLFGGAFAMGAGIWSMHFIGMLAFIMPMPMRYELTWTGSSLLVAMLASGFALYILKAKETSLNRLALGGIFIGFGIAAMHYMGMHAMSQDVKISYLPSLFILSICIAIFAAEASLWLALQSNQGSTQRQFYLKIISALIMGLAICGMHYTGMAAAIFVPLHNHDMTDMSTINPNSLAFFIAGVTALIISLALAASSYYKQMVNAVQNEKDFLNSMLNNLQDGIIACDAEGNITVFNNVLQQQHSFKFPSNAIFEMARQLQFYKTDGKPLTSTEYPLYRALHGERIHAQEYTMRFADTNNRNVVVDGQPIINEGGRKLGAVIVVHDITELKKTEKMKNEFVSVVSHELRTPLTSIRGSLGLILGGAVGKFSEKANKLLDIANKNCERLLLLINDILDMEKIQAGKMNFQFKLTNIEQITTETISTNKPYGEKFGIKIELNTSLPNVMVKVDPDRLAQVLTNLISNAVKFSPPNGSVTLSITQIKNLVRVAVTDKGIGIPFEFQPRVFQKFSQADSSTTRGKGGTGLGLSISKAMIEKMGGQLNFVSEPKVETIFYFDLPVVSTEARDVKDPEKDVPVNRISSERRLLICEDDPDQAAYLNLLLDAAGLQSDIASTVAEAKTKIASYDYAAILLDLILPDQDGISFIKELKKNDATRDIPIIVLSVIAQTGHSLINGDAISVLDWLDKPVNFNMLLRAMAKIKNPQANGSKPLILHVEDDADTTHVMDALLKEDVDIICSTTIEETKDILKQHHFNLVILDLLLPDGNGIELLPLFSSYKLPVIVYSATELDSVYSKYVIETLLKSTTTNAALVMKIKQAVRESTRDEHHDI